ncbi:M20 peptidase aminoacylase family protein [Brevibacillus fluminis]|uniref:M20 peptidase aminoacylase family protein n=1 Tax=Brevibacillus fluminis TaxID=511487 RepID=UPI003F8B5DA3
MIDQLKQWIEANREKMEATYHDLHALAEVSWQEHRSTAYLCRELEAMGVAYETFSDSTGVIAYAGEAEATPVVGLRADMDALWQLVDGKWQANHSCGHDAHMTMALHALRCVKELGVELQGRLKVIFQPAEETGEGARALVQRGVIDDLDHLIGIHVRPYFEVPSGSAAPAIRHGAIAQVRGKLKGEQAHAARPNLGTNVVDALSLLITAVNAVKVDPTTPMSAKVTMVKAGGDNLNIIPDEAQFGLDLRAQTNEAMEWLLARVLQAIEAAATANGAVVELEPVMQLHAAVPNREMEQLVASAIVETLGEEKLAPAPVTPGGEDFHCYAVEKPGLATTMIGLGTGLSPGLHHPQMRFDLGTLANGVAVMAASAIKLLGHAPKNNS